MTPPTKKNKTKKTKNETDSPWQEVLENFFQPFMELCFPEWAKKIHWETPYKSLKCELPDPAGKQICDMIFEVEMLNGEKEIIFLHFEVQGQMQKDFSYRMMSYNFSIYKKYKKRVVSTAIFIDDDPTWRPNCFEQQHPFSGNIYHQFFFDTVKLLDYRGKEEELKKEKNIFALIFLAQLAVMEAKENQAKRQEKKTALTRELFNRGLKKNIISKLYKFIDWLIKLDLEHMMTFKEEVKNYAEKESWQDWDPVYVSTFEQVAKIEGHREGRQEGRQEGRKEGRKEGKAALLIRQLKHRFPREVTDRHLFLINEADEETLSSWAEKIMDVKSIDEIFLDFLS